MILRNFLITISIAVLAIGSSFAFTPDVQLPVPADEHRAQSLFKEIRCVVCQSESIGESQAEVAKDMRRLIREHIVSGKNDSEIKEFLSSRYGDAILMAPPFKSNTIALWVAPLFFLFAGTAIALTYFRRHKTSV